MKLKIDLKFKIKNLKFRKHLLRGFFTLLLLTTLFAIASKYLSKPAIASWWNSGTGISANAIKLGLDVLY